MSGILGSSIMSRIGKNPIILPDGVNCVQDDDKVTISGKRGELSLSNFSGIKAVCENNTISLVPSGNDKKMLSMWGTARSLLQNMVKGVSEGFVKTLQIQGVGYKAQAKGKILELSLGFSHDIKYSIPEGIEIKTPQPTQIVVTGSDKQQVGQIAAEIRSFRPPEPYKGKGVRYDGEIILRKEGKKK